MLVLHIFIKISSAFDWEIFPRLWISGNQTKLVALVDKFVWTELNSLHAWVCFHLEGLLYLIYFTTCVIQLIESHENKSTCFFKCCFVFSVESCLIHFWVDIRLLLQGYVNTRFSSLIRLTLDEKTASIDTFDRILYPLILIGSPELLLEVLS